jgi:23S rRNA U2552 (ribose-2'-O)-methylase RlmE/FtsJ
MVFEVAKGYKPRSSRDVSREMFIVGEWKKR